MKKLLKIKEFLNLKKRDAESCSGNSRAAKRSRGASKGHEPYAQAEQSITRGVHHDQFLKLFESETAKDIVWWLPGRRGEAFAMNKERFEQELLKIHFQEPSFADFAKQLNMWGYRQMNIPSLSGRILSFEISSKGALLEQGLSKRAKGVGQTKKSKSEMTSHNNSREQIELPAGSLASLQLQQTQYLVQQEISHAYFSLLWQELQRQLSSVLLQQAQLAATPTEQQQQPDPMTDPPRSTIADVAALLHQQQVQQQIVAATVYPAAVASPLGLSDEHAVVQELNDIHQQQLNSLTYQIVALVAGNVEQHNPQAELSESSLLQKVLAKYLIVLVLLQLQQQQQNLEFLRQDRLTALVLIRSLRRNSPSGGAVEDSPSIHSDQALQPVSSLHAQQLLSEAAMLSLSRAHHLLSEAAILTPLLAPQAALAAPPPLHQQQPAFLQQGHLPGDQLAAAGGAFAGVGLAPSPPPPPLATTAR